MALLASPQHRSSKLKNDLRLCGPQMVATTGKNYEIDSRR